MKRIILSEMVNSGFLDAQDSDGSSNIISYCSGLNEEDSFVTMRVRNQTIY